jgi:hypothetical protein
MADVRNFTVDDLEQFSAHLRVLGGTVGSMTAAAEAIARYLHDELVADDRTSECVLVSVYKTHLFERLPGNLQELALEVDQTVESSTACLARLATVGADDPNAGPEAVVRPLTQRALQEEPILMALLQGMGLDPDVALDPARAMTLALHHRRLGTFFVPDLRDSQWVEDSQAQAVVRAMGIVSLLGIGGALPNGDLYFVFWFTNQRISERSGDLMGSLAPAIAAALVPHTLRPFGADV